MGAGGRRLLELEERPRAVRDQQASDLFHFALLLPSRAALGRQLAHLIRTDTPLSGASDHFVSEALYLRDPDGHGIELYSDRPREVWYANGRLRMGTTALAIDDLLEAGRAEDAGTQALAPGTVIGHVHLETWDMPRSVAFYVDRLGLAVTTERPGATFMSVGGYHHHLALNTWGRKSRPAAPDDEHIAMLWYEMELPDREDLAKIAARSRSVGARGRGAGRARPERPDRSVPRAGMRTSPARLAGWVGVICGLAGCGRSAGRRRSTGSCWSSTARSRSTTAS